MERPTSLLKLQLAYPRRPCNNLNATECMEPDPPFADFPNGWSGTSDLLYIDIKMPSEHYIEGQRYAAEMQMYHLHAVSQRVAVWSVLIRAEPNTTGHNYYFDPVIQAFQREYDHHQEQCSGTATSSTNNNTNNATNNNNTDNNATTTTVNDPTIGEWENQTVAPLLSASQ